MSTQEGPVGNAGEGLAWAVHELAIGVAALDAVLARRLGLNHTDYLALKHVLAPGTGAGPMTPAQLSRRLGMATGSTTTVVDRLERSGHLERRGHPRDRRKLELLPTRHAVESIEAALAPVAAGITDLERTWSPEQRRIVGTALADLARLHHGLSA